MFSSLLVLTAGTALFLYPQLPETNRINSVPVPKCTPLDNEGLKDLSLKAVGVAHVQTEKQVDEEVEKLFAPVYQRIPEYVDYRFSYKYRFVDQPIEFWNSLWSKSTKQAFVKIIGADFASQVQQTQERLDAHFQKSYVNAFLELHPCFQFEWRDDEKQMLVDTATRLISTA